MKVDGQSSAEHEEFKMAYFWTSVKDWKTWAFAVIYMGCDGSLYAFSLFLPSIVQQLYPGISSTKANLLSVPPYAGKSSALWLEVKPHKVLQQLTPFSVAAVVTVFIGWLADRTKARGLCNISTSFLGIIGFAMLLGAPADAAGVKYAGTFLGAWGIYPNV